MRPLTTGARRRWRRCSRTAPTWTRRTRACAAAGRYFGQRSACAMLPLCRPGRDRCTESSMETHNLCTHAPAHKQSHTRTHFTHAHISHTHTFHARTIRRRETPLHRAADHGHVAAVEALLTHGADVNAKNSPDGCGGRSPFSHATHAPTARAGCGMCTSAIHRRDERAAV
jgi:hypothetical protein